jgi:predicted Zn-dependent protease
MTLSSRRNFLKAVARAGLWGFGGGSALALFLKGCKTLDEMAESGTSFSIGSYNINTASIAKSVNAVSKSFEDITPEQEYYIGRTVGAMVLEKYKPYQDPAANRYVNVLGQSLAQASDMPETFGGYHFLIQDSDEINAFAAPGGLIFITRGILRCCQHEDAVAAVLAHEIGHVQYKHGLQAIKKSRVTTAVTTLALEGTKTFGGDELATLTSTFEDSISDISQTLIVNGYSRSFEYQADAASITILKRIGYNPSGLVDMLNVMNKRLKPGGADFAKTHPAPSKRIAQIKKIIVYSKNSSPSFRQARFKRAVGRI